MTSYFGIADSSIRRGRTDADSTFPLVKREAYQIEIRKGGVLVRTADVDNANWSYSASQRMADLGSPDAEIDFSVAMVSAATAVGRRAYRTFSSKQI